MTVKKPAAKPKATKAKSKAAAAPIKAAKAVSQTTDWEVVEGLYRVGFPALRTIASKHGCTEGAIRKRAKKESWARDLKAKVQAKAEELVRKNEVRKTVRNECEVTEALQISVAATMQADIIIGHRRDIPAVRRLTSKMFIELELQTDGIDLLKDLGKLMRKDNESGQDKRNDLYNKVIALAGRSATLKSLVDSLKVLVALEREAFGLDDAAKGSAADSMADFLTELSARGSRLPLGGRP